MAALLALAMRHLGTPSLWRDEVSSVVFAKGSLGDLLTIIGRDRDAVGLANMATYYLLLHFWLAVGETESRIRLLSVLFGVASVVPVYFIARRLGGWLAAALAAGIFALIPYVIHYSQEARGYSLAMLIGGALTWLVLIGVERGRGAWWPWLAYGLIAALGLYVHFFVALVVAAHGLWLLVTRQVPGWRGIAAGDIPLLLAAAPIPLIIVQFGGEHGWIPPFNLPRFYGAVVELTGSLWLLIGLTALLVVAAVLRRRDPRVWLLIASVLLPIAVVAVVSLFKPLLHSALPDHGAAHAGGPGERGAGGGAPRPAAGGPGRGTVRGAGARRCRPPTGARPTSDGAKRADGSPTKCSRAIGWGCSRGLARRWSTTCIAPARPPSS